MDIFFQLQRLSPLFNVVIVQEGTSILSTIITHEIPLFNAMFTITNGWVDNVGTPTITNQSHREGNRITKRHKNCIQNEFIHNKHDIGENTAVLMNDISIQSLNLSCAGNYQIDMYSWSLCSPENQFTDDTVHCRHENACLTKSLKYELYYFYVQRIA